MSSRIISSPDALLVGLLVGPDVVQVALGDDTQVDVAAGAQVVKDSRSDGVSHQPLGILLLSTPTKTNTNGSALMLSSNI